VSAKPPSLPQRRRGETGEGKNEGRISLSELAQAYAGSPKGQPPVPPAQLALAVILQAYARVGDDEVIEATVMDRRWQLVLDCLGAEEPPFSKGPWRGSAPG
jgi:hypothetical protein